jgi:type IV secretory pathway TraG/TraD family ATPase VirD4
MIEIHGSGIVNAQLSQVPILAVNVLDRLGYHVTRASKQLDQVLATERLDEKIGQDWWHHEYKIVIRWEPVDEGQVEVTIDLKEVKGGASQFECQKRLDQILLELHEDARRMQAKNKQKEKSTAYGAAKWGAEDDLAKKGYFQDVPDAKRLIIGRTADRKYIQVPEFWTHAHALICGRTGVGKSRGFFVPQLIERIGTSMVVTEATPGSEAGELYKLTSGWRKMAGHEIYCFNSADMSSHRINPIDSVRFAPEEEKASRAEKIADLVIMNGESGEVKNEQTWNRSEKLLLMPLILHAAAGDPEIGHFGALRWHLLQGPAHLAKLMKFSPSNVAQMEFEGWLSLSGETNFKYGVFSGLITKLNPWLTDQMVTLTETTDIDLAALKEQLFTFYLAVPSRSKDSKLIGSLILNFLLDHILEIREEMKYPVTMLLDEFTNFGKIMGIGETLSIIRKNKIGLTLGFQNYFQLEQVYSRKEAQIIMDQPATQVYFKQKNFREAKELSEALGRTTVEEAAVTDAGRVHELVQGRQLITPDELIGLDKEVIVFTADTRPLKLPLTEPTSYDQAMAYDPPSRSKHKVTEFVRRRGRADAAQDSQQDPFDIEKGKKARQGSPPNARPQNAEKTKSTSANQEKTTKATPADERVEAPSMPIMEDVATPPPADDDAQGPAIEDDDIAPDFGV